MAVVNPSTPPSSVTADWKKAQNCVAKRYKKDGVRNETYFTDVLVRCLQRTATQRQGHHERLGIGLCGLLKW